MTYSNITILVEISICTRASFQVSIPGMLESWKTKRTMSPTLISRAFSFWALGMGNGTRSKTIAYHFWKINQLNSS